MSSNIKIYNFRKLSFENPKFRLKSKISTHCWSSENPKFRPIVDHHGPSTHHGGLTAKPSLKCGHLY